MKNDLKNELHHVFSGESQVRFGTIIQAITRYLSYCSKTSEEIEREQYNKNQEGKNLEEYIADNNLWIAIDLSQYVSEGAEQKVYLKDSEHVLKLNDAIYYTS